ncbi:NAD(P)H-dependent oxidoreductase [Novosphingobium rosa]|uniref:NAD(P)H-dependent oxidoreductase n=1 Tax=Novosphingobium rosa TaxID=76978 RepID=UPI00082D015C|nr:NAD(P)H-dependent oxidoreductase [Novosphingobium rosa]
MKLLIVYAHPSPTSFNAALRDAAAQEAVALGHEVQISDLYASGFGAVGGPQDFLVLETPGQFHYQSEQRAAALKDGFSREIAQEQEKLRWADCLMLQFPIWWGGPPAILKGWIDRVCAYGVTYADGTRFATGLFQGRRSLLSVTTGGSARRFSDEGEYGAMETVLWPIQQLFLGYLGYELNAPLVCYSAPRIDAAARDEQIATLRARIRSLLHDPIESTPLPSPRQLLDSIGDRSWTSQV